MVNEAVPPHRSDFYDAAEWTQVLVGIGERFRSRVDGKVLQAMLSEMLAADTEFAVAATADRMRHEATRAAPATVDRLDDKLSGLQSALGDLEASYSSMGSGHDNRASEAARAMVAAAEREKSQKLAEARAEAELIREQAVTMAESMIASAADEADQRRRIHDKAIAEGRVATEAEAVKVLEDALADADFIRTSAEEAGARAVAEAESGAEALRRAVVEEIAALRTSAEADMAAMRAPHEPAPAAETTDPREEADALRRVATEEAAAIREAAEAEARAIRDAAADEAERVRVEAVLAATVRSDAHMSASADPGASAPAPEPTGQGEPGQDHEPEDHSLFDNDGAPDDGAPQNDGAPEHDGGPRIRRRGLSRRHRVSDAAPAPTVADEASADQASTETDAPDAPAESYRRRRRGGAGA